MTSQALTSSALHTSSTVPTRLRQRHSLRDNEWRAIARAWIAEVQRSLYSHHSTCHSIAPGAGTILTLYPSTQGRATMVRSRGTAGTRANNASPKGVSDHCDPLELGRALARPLHSLTAIPKPLVTRRADRHHQRPRCEGALLARPTNRWTKSCE